MDQEWRGLAETLYHQGLNDSDIARKCGVSRETIGRWRRFKGYVLKIAPFTIDRPNPCFVCQRNIAECSWLHENKPVPGWDAVLVVKKAYKKTKKYEYATWAIKDCPLYISPKEREDID